MDLVVVLGSIFAVHIAAMISPGPNFLIVTQTAMSRTRRTGTFVALGVAAGAGVWSTVASLGLTVLFTYYAWLYSGLKLLGGIYLIYLGIDLWRKSCLTGDSAVNRRSAANSDWQAFRLGLVTNLLNPKAAIFFGSIFAAIVSPDLPTWFKVAAVSLIMADAASWHIALACFFSARRAQQCFHRFKKPMDRLTGAALALVGARLIWQAR